MPKTINKSFEAIEAEHEATLRTLNVPVQEYNSLCNTVSLLRGELEQLLRQKEQQNKIIENQQKKIDELTKNEE